MNGVLLNFSMDPQEKKVSLIPDFKQKVQLNL